MGPNPLPKSSNVFSKANACPLLVGIVTFVNVAFTIGPVTLAPTPDIREDVSMYHVTLALVSSFSGVMS
eukprot:4141397-Ditylum_brightwellii.AAC.1